MSKQIKRVRIDIRVTEAMLEALTTAAGRVGLKTSEYTRRIVADHLVNADASSTLTP